MSSQKGLQDIVIIGGGIIGCTTAYYLTHHPLSREFIRSVTIIEASRLANGASGKAGGLVAAWAYPNSLAQLSFDLHAQLAQDHDGTALWGYRRVRCGQLTAVATLNTSTRASNSRSYPAIDLGKSWPQDLRNSSVLPDGLDWVDDKSAQEYEEFADETSTAQVHPWQFTTSMAKLATERGAIITIGKAEHINCCNIDAPPEEALPLTSSDDLSRKRVISVTYMDKVTSTKITIPASTVVVAAGPWTPTLFPKVKIVPLRAHSVSIKLKRPMPAYCLFSSIHLLRSQPSSGKKSVTLELYARPNNEVYICSQGDLDTSLLPPEEPVEVSAEICQDMIDAATNISGELRNGQVTGRRACYLPVVNVGANANPLVGYTEVAGLVLATGHSCWGISNAPGTGKLISELILDGQMGSIDATVLDPKTIRYGRGTAI